MRAIGDDVVAKLSVSALGGAVDLTAIRADPVHHQLEVTDQAFHRVVDQVLGRQGDLGIVQDEGPLGQAIEGKVTLLTFWAYG